MRKMDNFLFEVLIIKKNWKERILLSIYMFKRVLKLCLKLWRGQTFQFCKFKIMATTLCQLLLCANNNDVDNFRFSTPADLHSNESVTDFPRKSQNGNTFPRSMPKNKHLAGNSLALLFSKWTDFHLFKRHTRRSLKGLRRSRLMVDMGRSQWSSNVRSVVIT